MDFKDMTDNFMDDDQYFNVGGVLGAIKFRKIRLNKEEKVWALKYPITDDLQKLDVVTRAAKRKLALLPTNTNKDRVSRTALASYISKLEKHKEDILNAIEEEELRKKEEAEKKIKEAEEKKKKEEEEKQAKEEAEKSEKAELERQKLELSLKNNSSDGKKSKTLLYVGIGVGVIIIATILYFTLTKKQNKI